MLKAISCSFSALHANQQMLNTTAHNLANLKTVAYQEKKVSFHDLPSRSLLERRLPNTGDVFNVLNSGRGVSVSSITASPQKGTPLYTGRQLDLGITGEGFFRVTRPDGTHAYTRGGNFSLDGQGNLITPGGSYLDFTLQSPDLQKEADLSNIHITAQGAVYVYPREEGGGEGVYFFEGDESEEIFQGMIKLGEIHLYRFPNPQGLENLGENLLMPSSTSGAPIQGRPGEEGLGELQQGFLESSNVDLATQMTMLIHAQRSLQASVRALTTGDELWALTLNLQAY